jgi:hypothetical protein
MSSCCRHPLSAYLYLRGHKEASTRIDEIFFSSENTWAREAQLKKETIMKTSKVKQAKLDDLFAAAEKSENKHLSNDARNSVRGKLKFAGIDVEQPLEGFDLNLATKIVGNELLRTASGSAAEMRTAAFAGADTGVCPGCSHKMTQAKLATGMMSYVCSNCRVCSPIHLGKRTMDKARRIRVAERILKVVEDLDKEILGSSHLLARMGEPLKACYAKLKERYGNECHVEVDAESQCLRLSFYRQDSKTKQASCWARATVACSKNGNKLKVQGASSEKGILPDLKPKMCKNARDVAYAIDCWMDK